jgi:hypothetical protein
MPTKIIYTQKIIVDPDPRIEAKVRPCPAVVGRRDR